MKSESGQEDAQVATRLTYSKLLGFVIVTFSIFGAAYTINAVLSMLASGYCQHDEAFWAALFLGFETYIGFRLYKNRPIKAGFPIFSSMAILIVFALIFVVLNLEPSEYFGTKVIYDTSKDLKYGWPVPFLIRFGDDRSWSLAPSCLVLNALFLVVTVCFQILVWRIVRAGKGSCCG